MLSLSEFVDLYVEFLKVGECSQIVRQGITHIKKNVLFSLLFLGAKAIQGALSLRFFWGIRGSMVKPQLF